MDTLRDLLNSRGLSQEAMAVIGEVDPATVSRILSGQSRARPVTIVRLARGLGVSPRRMQRMCDAHWLAAHPEDNLSREAVSA